MTIVLGSTAPGPEERGSKPPPSYRQSLNLTTCGDAVLPYRVRYRVAGRTKPNAIRQGPRSTRDADSWLETIAHNRAATRYRTPGPNGNMV